MAAKKSKRSMVVCSSPISMKDGKVEPGILLGWQEDGGYQIKRVTNSVAYPGQALTKAQVQALIDDDWTVTVS
jgi:hypothetical protein